MAKYMIKASYSPEGIKGLMAKGGTSRKDEVATFLTERYRLFSTIAGTLVYAPVEHVPWPLREVRVTRILIGM